jgi:hypothetical protein
MVVDAVLQDDALPIVGDFVTAPAGRAPPIHHLWGRRLRGHRDLAALIRALDRTVMDSKKEWYRKLPPEPPLTGVQ